MEQLDSGQIHLWLAWLGEIADARHLNEYQQLLSEEELEKQARFRFERDRHRYLVTRAMVRTVLSKYADVEPREWQFAVNEHGKPSIATEHATARGLEFNASHTVGLVALAVARGRAIGVDVENIRSLPVDLAIADRYFASVEVDALHALPREQQLRRFFEYWTLKESYIKARGMGLSIPLDRFAFSLEGSPPIQLTVDPSLRDSAERWMHWQVPVADEYLAAVCAERGGGGQLELSSPHLWP
jgi:4'-phosphopantetheinyl transferase